MRQLDRKIKVVFGLALGAVLVLGIVSAYTSQSQIAALALAGDVNDRLQLLESLLSDIYQLESAQRAFLLSHSNLYLDEYKAFKKDVSDELSQLGNTVFETSEQQDQARRLATLFERRIKLMDSLVATAQSGDQDLVIAKVTAGGGKQIMDQIREAGRIINSREATLLGITRQQAADRARTLLGLLVLLMAVAAALVILGVVFFAQARQRGVILIEQLKSTSDQISQLNQLGNALQACEGMSSAAPVIGQFMQRFCPSAQGSMYIARSSRDMLELKAAWGESADSSSQILEPGECWGLRLGRTHEFTPGESYMRCAHVPDHVDSRYICVPMMAQGEAIGLLHLRDMEIRNSHDAAAGSRSIRERTESAALQMGPALASLILRERLRLHSVRDPLTGLYNRRYLEETMGRELIRAQRSGTEFAVIMVDVDHFKSLNDEHGHQAGDLVLQSFAAYLRDGVRGDDIACRYGGEEFTLVLPGASLSEARDRAQLLCAGCADIRIRFQGAQLQSVTASFGVAAFPGHGESWEAVIRQADSALYRAKREGRNRVVVASSLVNTAKQSAD